MLGAFGKKTAYMNKYRVLCEALVYPVSTVKRSYSRGGQTPIELTLYLVPQYLWVRSEEIASSRHSDA